MMGTFKRYVGGALAIIVCAAVIAGCGTVRQGDTVVIGVNLGLSGTGMSYGESTEQGIELAKDRINEQGGLLGKRVELVSVDNHGNAEDAAAAMRQLAMRRVTAIIGPNLTECAMAVIPDAQAVKIPVISPAGTHPDITVDAKSREVYKYMFRATFIDSYQGRAMADYAISHLRARTAAVIYHKNNVYSGGLAEFFKRGFLADSGTVPLFIGIENDDTDMTAALAEVRSVACDVIYAPFYDQWAMKFILQARKSGISQPILGPDGWNGVRMAREIDSSYLTNLFYTDHYANDTKEKLSEEFAEAYYGKYGEWPDSYAALGYDSLMMTAEAIKRSKSGDPRSVAVELGKTIDFEGVTGKISLDTNHDAIKNVFVLTFQKGKPVLLEKRPTGEL
ncbi:ABC transporter substrate-binding protein [Megasphaera cerevisiae]|jgi:branched-chain amino acid transport system substrate-binding protein|nr:ABC transporter substrate-binding protein [Megasphaera cerevisiae]OKY52573.1 amino acid/amide ABC transporter substrate-binding protein [Megasphaera cerevisiae]SJZ63389.1 branched-chain amino acid transport system substrate-binding protein [Megasphaera cerevisiae DSM 20462]